MKKLPLSVVLLCSICFLHAQIKTPSLDYADVKEMVEKFRISIVNADSILASSIFLPSPKTSFIHARGDEQGWEEINRNVYKFLGDTYSVRKLTITHEDYLLFECVTRVELHYTFDAVLKKDNSSVQIKYRETQLWTKMGNEWRLVEVHDSNMPVNGTQQSF